MFTTIKRQCLYRALHKKLAGQYKFIEDAWTQARLAQEPTLHFLKESVKIHSKMERAESKMWWVTRKML